MTIASLNWTDREPQCLWTHTDEVARKQDYKDFGSWFTSRGDWSLWTTEVKCPEIKKWWRFWHPSQLALNLKMDIHFFLPAESMIGWQLTCDSIYVVDTCQILICHRTVKWLEQRYCIKCFQKLGDNKSENHSEDSTDFRARGHGQNIS